MVEGMKLTGHLGSEFQREEHIRNYACGEAIHGNDEKFEETLINVHDDGRHLSALFAKYVFLQRFGRIDQHEADKWMKGKVPKRWSLAAGCLIIKQ